MLDAVHSALFIIDKNWDLNNKKIIIWTDSEYTCNCAKVFIEVWKKNNWKKADGKPVKYQETIEQIAGYLDKYKGNVELRHISEVGIVSHETTRY
jgi:ribonuclease HI